MFNITLEYPIKNETKQEHIRKLLLYIKNNDSAFDTWYSAIKEKYPDKKIWLEDESQRIGTVNIPQDMWIHMRKCEIVFLDIPFFARLNYLVETYGTLNKIALRDAIGRIQKRLGGLETKTAIFGLWFFK